MVRCCGQDHWVCVCVFKEVGVDERSRVDPDGKNKTTLEEVIALPMREGSSLINMQPCPVPGPAGLEEECYPGLRSLHPAQKSHLQAVLGGKYLEEKHTLCKDAKIF